LGARAIAQHLARSLGVPVQLGNVTRLLVDLNRPLAHPRLFSEFSRRLASDERTEILLRYHQPYWQSVQQAVQQAILAGDSVLHLSIHSFTPVLDDRERHFEVGLLYDPTRAREKALALDLRASLAKMDRGLAVRQNAPYRGASAGLTSSLRERFEPRQYLGLEVELNQRLTSHARGRARLGKALVGAVQRLGFGTASASWANS
jgi:predicted N-formylglutamate amidohydrolase